MRKDLAKVMHDTRGSRSQGRVDKYHYHRHELKNNLDEDADTKFESMTKWTSSNRRGVDVRCNILKRILFKEVGRPWNKVYSELCELLPKNDVLLRDSINWIVEQKAFVEKGKVVVACGWGSGAIPVENSHRPFYVCPKTGMLKKIPKEKRHRREDNRYKFITIDDYHQIHKISGVWYLITLADVPTDQVWVEVLGHPQSGYWTNKRYKDVSIDAIYDGVDKNNTSSWNSYNTSWWNYYKTQAEAFYGRKDVYAVNKKQLNSKELRNYDLKNDLPKNPDPVRIAVLLKKGKSKT